MQRRRERDGRWDSDDEGVSYGCRQEEGCSDNDQRR